MTGWWNRDCRLLQVYVHPLARHNISKNVLELLHTLAHYFPGHFVPQCLRKDRDTHRPEATQPRPAAAAFWQAVVGGGGQQAAGGKPNKVCLFVVVVVYLPLVYLWQELCEVVYDTMEEAPLGQLLALLDEAAVVQQASLHEKMIKLLKMVRGEDWWVGV